MNQDSPAATTPDATTAETGEIPLRRDNFDLFYNREISWLQFNFRVLEEAFRKDNPLLERLKFLSITESNLDEFFMVRVAGLKQVSASEVNEIQMDGRTPEETLAVISQQVHHMVNLQYQALREITVGLKEVGLELIDDFRTLNESERQICRDFFHKELHRIVTPMAIDTGHPFPHITSGRLNQAITLRRKNPRKNDPELVYAVVEVPSVVPRFLEMPRVEGGPRRLLPLEEIIKMNAGELFNGTTVESIHGFTITRNSDLEIDEVASENLLSTIESELKNRRWGEAVRLNYRAGMPDSLRDFLKDQLDLTEDELYERPGLLNLKDLMDVYFMSQDMKEQLDIPFIPRNAVQLESKDRIFSAIREKDILLHHPYDSFQTVVDMLAQAARDPKVLAIKQTLYRTGGNSPIVKALIEAAENDKQVTVLVELKARFDEERNILWAKEMEKHGVHVVYGLVGLKIHGKMLQIIRREPDGVRSYVHLSTGNYNPGTAKLYTDLSLITADVEINQDVTNLFHALTGYSDVPKLTRISAAPVSLRETLVELIDGEIAHARAGRPARIRAKLNSLVDPEMILKLYEADRAGVKIELNVRGICCLRPGVAGVSENISVVSIVGRFLEHSRIFYFENGGDPRVFLASADWMQRNLNRRVEVLFPTDDPDVRAEIIHILDMTFRDNHNARRIHADGTFTRVEPPSEEERFSSQRFFREETTAEFEEKVKAAEERRKTAFQPVVNAAVDGDSGAKANKKD